MSGSFRYRLPPVGKPWLRPASSPLGFLEKAAWLGREILMVAGWLDLGGHEPASATVGIRGRRFECVPRRVTRPRNDIAVAPLARGEIWLLRSSSFDGHGRLDAVSIRLDGRDHRWSARGGLSIFPYLDEELTAHLRDADRGEMQDALAAVGIDAASLESDDAVLRANAEVLATILGAGSDGGDEPAPDDDSGSDGEVSGDTAAAEPAPRPREIEVAALGYPFVADPATALGYFFEWLMVVGPRVVFVSGWLWDVSDVLRRVDLVTLSGLRYTDLLRDTVRYPRTDLQATYAERFPGLVEQRACGFAGRRSFAGDLPCDEQLLLEVISEHGVTLHRAPHVLRDLPSIRRELFRCLAPVGLDVVGIEEQLLPLLEEITRRWEAPGIERTLHFAGDEDAASNGSPRSVASIVPLGSRLQLAEFFTAADAARGDVEECEIVFVLCDPHLVDQASQLVAGLAKLYASTCTLVVPEAPLSGVPEAWWLGASVTGSPVITLWDGGSLPHSRGGPSRAARSLATAERVGAIAGRGLLGEGVLAHDGMELRRDSRLSNRWQPRPRDAGLPVDLAAPAVAGAVAAAGLGMVAMRRAQFLQLGSPDVGYVGLDCALADLSMRVWNAGLEVHCDPEIETWYPGKEEVGATVAASSLSWVSDRLLFDRRWRDLIERSPWATSRKPEAAGDRVHSA